jgi:Flp pilus assembly protein protease CpaA
MEDANLLLLDIARFAPLIAIMGYAAYQDHKTGEVPNKVWLYAIPGALLTTIETLLEPQLVFATLLSIAVTITIALVMFYVGGSGGADTKAYLTLAVSAPLTLPYLAPILFLPLVTIIIAGITAGIYGVVKGKKEVRYIPFIFIGLIASAFL